MPPPVYTPRQAPEYSDAVSTTSSSLYTSSYRFLQKGFEDKVDIRSVPYNKRAKKPTVFRPFPCRSFSKPDTEFEPYRIDPAGKNYFGWWLARVPAAWKIGNPSTSFLLHNPFSRTQYDSRLTPLSTLHRAISFAVKKGQGKAQEWADSIRRPFDPDAQTVLEWSGAQTGSHDKGAILKPPTELCLMQGTILLYGGEPTPVGKPPIGWGDRPTCVLALTAGAGDKAVELLGQEREGFRGHPGDFANRYVEGDPVSLDSGKFLVVYPKGGDPRQAHLASHAADNYDPFSATSGGAQHGSDKKDDDFGFDCHWAATFENRPASFTNPEHRALIRDKWIHWEDMLWFPTFVEQAAIMAGIFPASMLVYAFAGEHPEWLTSDVRARAVGAHSAAVPAAPPPSSYSPPPAAHGGDPRFSSDNNRGMAAPPPPPMNTQPVNPFDIVSGGVPDAALPRPSADPFTAAPPPPPTTSSSPLDAQFSQMMADFPGGDAASVPLPPPVPTDFGFGPPQGQPQQPDRAAPAASSSAAAIAAAKAALGG